MTKPLRLRPQLAILLAAALYLTPAASAMADEWGTLKGTFVFGGEAAAPSALTVDKDVEVCGKHKLVAEELVVGEGKGVANVVVFVRDKEVKVKPELEAAAKAAKPVLDNADCRFEPHVVVVQVGQEFVIKNSDTVGHNSNINSMKSPSNDLIPAGGQVTKRYMADEAVPAQVTCNIHPWMKGWIVIRDNPYAAVSKADGTFEIADLPAEEVELQFWHEKAGYIGEMTLGGKQETLKKGRLKKAIKAGDNDMGVIVLDPGLFK
jgi:plastocyanin